MTTYIASSYSILNPVLLLTKPLVCSLPSFQNNYPELLSAKLFLHVPRVLEFAFALFSAFSDVDTRKKFVMVSSPNTRPTLLRYINADQLPTIYGGLGDAKSRTEVYRAAVPAGASMTGCCCSVLWPGAVSGCCVRVLWQSAEAGVILLCCCQVAAAPAAVVVAVIVPSCSQTENHTILHVGYCMAEY